jgi:hypothetical protein
MCGHPQKKLPMYIWNDNMKTRKLEISILFLE